MSPLPAFWSIHDVSPATLGRASHLVDRLEGVGIAPLTILIVPAGDWPSEAIKQLRLWAQRGHLLAAHGWSHRAVEQRSFVHRVHSLVLSRDAAEHLSRSRADVKSIVDRSAHWFVAHDLPAPALYVPPAWAAGQISNRGLHARGFELIETLTGITDTNTGKRRFLPLVGFEADTRFRAIAVRALNGANLALARLTRRPIRVAVHPDDERLLLHDQLDAWMAMRWLPIVPESPLG